MSFGPQRTQEQSERADLINELLVALPLPAGEPWPPDVLWIHFTDWHGMYDLRRLLDEGLIERHPSLVYRPRGDWQDQFPPDAYRLTAKGRAIAKQPGRWVFRGAWNDDAK